MAKMDKEDLKHVIKRSRKLFRGEEIPKVHGYEGEVEEQVTRAIGEIWTDKDGKESIVPVIFDPATYYGDREADVAMTYLFGGFGSDFYEGYESVWPLPEGHEKRKTVYNLYHILNHDVLFGGGYIRQAQGMISQILKM